MIVSENQAKLQFALQKIAIAWGFCLVVTSFNRVAIVDLGIPAMLIAFVIGAYTLFGPLQPVIGRITERYPICGYRRTPYMLLGTLLGSSVFPFFPNALAAMQAGSLAAIFACLFLFCCFGLAIAMQANTFLDLVKDTTREEARSRITTMTWTVQALAMAFWAWVFSLFMREYSLQQMQFLYCMSPLAMLGLTLLGVLKLETRLTKEQLAALKRNPPPPVAFIEPMRESMAVLGHSRQARLFFAFIVFSLLSVFLQDLLQEIWAGDLFAMSAGESTVFQRIYNGLQTVGMAAMGIFVSIRAKRRRVALAPGEETGPTLPMAQGKPLLLFGALLSAAAFLLLAYAAYFQNLGLFHLFYACSAFSLGLFVFPAISFMADMTVPGQESRYLGLWSLAQVAGLFLSFTLSGTLYTALVESGLLAKNSGFALLFALQALMVMACWLLVRPISVQALRAGDRGAA